jgi:hypothetical protein
MESYADLETPPVGDDRGRDGYSRSPAPARGYDEQGDRPSRQADRDSPAPHGGPVDDRDERR